MAFGTPEFWVALLQIIGINIVLSGDNAVVIALAARGLPAQQQKQAVAWGSGAAVVMRIVLTIVAVELLKLPFLKLIGAGLLIWIAVQLLLPEDGDEEGGAASGGMAAAIKTILIADLVMSLDNVIGVAAAAKGSIPLLVIGLAISIPLVIFASQVLLKVMERYPVIITLGAALLGWVGGEMAVTDPWIKTWVDTQAAWLHWIGPATGVALVLALGRWLTKRQARLTADSQVEQPPLQVSTNPDRILLAVDGSGGSLAAVRQVLALHAAHARPQDFKVDLVNVQHPVSGRVSSHVAESTLQGYHLEASTTAMAAARQLLKQAGLNHELHTRIGEPAAEISALARELGSGQIVMGSRGLGATVGALLGSVATATLAQSPVPVLLVKSE